MRDDDIFRRLKKETPLVKRKDLQPLSSKDFAPKRSAFDVQLEKSNDKRAERGGYRMSVGGNRTSAEENDDAQTKTYSEEAERVQRPQPRTIQARSETRVRTSPEPLQRPQVRTMSAQPYSRPTASVPPAPKPVQPRERLEIPVQPSVAKPAQEIKPREEAPPQHIEITLKSSAAKPAQEVGLREEAPRLEVPKQTAAPKPSVRETLRQAEPRAERPKPQAARQELELGFGDDEKFLQTREYGQRTRKFREAYSKADASQLEIFTEAAPNSGMRVRTDSPALAPMVHRRTEFEEYFEPAQDAEASPAYRHELKFYINYHEYMLLRNTLKSLAQLDKYAGESGEYVIRSLYFDDEYESALMEKMGGSDVRKKYRVRIYNFSDDVIKFEKKIKQNQFVTKKTVNLTRDEYESILVGEFGFLLRRKEPLAPELFMELTTNRLRPRVVVDYVREAYVYPVESIRITFDKDLRSGMWRPGFTDIFDPRIPTMPMYEEGMMVLEVKFEKYLPGPIRGVLGNIGTAQRSAISKYVICRKFE